MECYNVVLKLPNGMLQRCIKTIKMECYNAVLELLDAMLIRLLACTSYKMFRVVCMNLSYN